MKLIEAFFKLIRWQNLVFIILTQTLFYFFIYKSLYVSDESYHELIWLIIASVLIAGGGYIINDYFDRNIDLINKPTANVLNKIINRRWAIILHLILSIAGILTTAIAVSFQKWYLIFANIICVILLWLYSTSFKRQLLVGNIVISILTAWTVLIIFFAKVPFSAAFGATEPETTKFFRISFLYAAFAFVISLIREAIKDIEDMEGDRRYGCKTLPLVAGVNATRIYTSVWLVVIIAALLILGLYVLQFNWWWAVVYNLLLVIVPLGILFIRILKASTTLEYKHLSSLAKWIMLSGILSMIFFRIYA